MLLAAYLRMLLDERPTCRSWLFSHVPITAGTIGSGELLMLGVQLGCLNWSCS